MVYLLLLLFVIIFSVAAAYFLHIFFRPYFKPARGRQHVFKCFAVLVLLSGAMAALVYYLQREPAYFEQGIRQLHQSKYIKEHVGDFSSFGYNKTELLKEPGDTAVFHAAIYGDSTTLFLYCTMIKRQSRWRLTKLHRDSIAGKN